MTTIEALFTPDELARGTDLFEQPWLFVKGVVDLDGLPPADRPEIAIAGRSNVGKSSLINAITRQNTLARTSNTPGRTQELNYFAPEESSFYLVDMPGYGFAEAPKDKVEAWTRLIKDYLRGRVTLARVILLIDARHGIKAVDAGIMALLDEAAVAYQIVLTKIDKIDDKARADVMVATQKKVAGHPAAFPVVLATSSEKSTGIEDLRAQIAAVVRDYSGQG